MLFVFPRDVLDKILNLIEPVSEGFPTYSSKLILHVSFQAYIFVTYYVLQVFTVGNDTRQYRVLAVCSAPLIFATFFLILVLL